MSETAGALVIKTDVDAAGVDVGVERVKRSLASLGEATNDVNSKAVAATDRYIKRLEVQNATMGMSTREAKLYELGLKGVSSAQIATVDSLLKIQEAANKASPSFDNIGMSAKQMSQEMRWLPKQFDDLGRQIAAGQSPMMAMYMQGSQLRDMFGGIGPAIGAVSTYVVGLINPLTLAAAAVASVGVAAYLGAKESEDFRKSLILTGNSAGVTAMQLMGMSQGISDHTRFTRGAAADALNQFAASGTASSKTIEQFATVALALERQAGIAVADTVKQFAELGKDPVTASAKLNETTHYLTAAVYDQIKSLQEQGKAFEAGKLAQEAYAQAMEARTKGVSENLGLLTKAWRGVADGAKFAWDSMLDIGREKTLDEKIKQLQQFILFQPSAQAAAAAQKELDGLKATETLNRSIAEQAERKSKADAAGIQWSKDGEQYKSKERLLEEAIVKAKNEGIAAGKSQAEIQERIGEIRRKYYGQAHDRRVDKSQLDADLQFIKNNLSEEVAANLGANKLLQAAHAAKFISDQDYFDAKLHIMQATTDAEENALIDEIARREVENFSGKRAVEDKIANGKEIEKLESSLAKLRTKSALDVALHGMEVAAANKRIAMSYEDARISAEHFLETIARQYARDVGGVGQGTEQRKIDSDLAGFDEKRIAKENELATKKRNDPSYSTDQYTKDLQLAQDTYQQEVDLYNKRTTDMLAANSHWEAGVSEAYKNLLTESRNVAAQTAAMFTQAFNSISKGFGDSVAQSLIHGASLQAGLKNVAMNVATNFISSYVETQAKKLMLDQKDVVMSALFGKAKLADKVATDQAGSASGITAKTEETTTNVGLAAIEGAANAFKAMAGIPVIGPVLAVGAAAAAMSFVTSLLSGSNSASASTSTVVNRNPYPTTTAVPAVAGARATGGPVQAGSLYEVNERGPEIITTNGRDYSMMGAKGGNVTPNSALQGGDMSSLASQAVPAVEIKVHAMPGSFAKDFFMIHKAELGKALASGRRDNVAGFA